MEGVGKAEGGSCLAWAGMEPWAAQRSSLLGDIQARLSLVGTWPCTGPVSHGLKVQTSYGWTHRSSVLSWDSWR